MAVRFPSHSHRQSGGEIVSQTLDRSQGADFAAPSLLVPDDRDERGELPHLNRASSPRGSNKGRAAIAALGLGPV